MGSWQTFSWSFGLGPISDPADGYDFTATNPVYLKVVDCCVVGDQFAIYVDGAPAVWTSTPTNVGAQSGAYDGDTAWANPDLSKGVWTLPAGTHHIGISLSMLAPDYTSGSGFISLNNVPEPGTLVLFGIGGALILVSRKFARR